MALAVCLTVGWLFLSSLSRAADSEYMARWSDGSTSSPATLRDWNDPSAEPRLGDRRLFEGSSSFTSLWRLPLSPLAKPGMRVELTGGDRLSGELLGWSSGQEDPYETQPPHFIFRPSTAMQPPEAKYLQTVRITASFVRRIVWEAVAGDAYQPGVVWLRNGGRIPFRTYRWNGASVNVLTSTGLRELSFAEIAEIHLPLDDEWSRYFETASHLTPDGKGLWVRLETNQGSLLTTSTQRLQGRHWGDRNRQADWYQLIQPAWSLDPLWIRLPQIVSWQTWLVTEPPLGWFTPSSVAHTPVFGSGWQPQWNTSVQGERLVTGSDWSQSGWGVFGSATLTFNLPPFVEAVHTGWGFDPAARQGGCASATIRWMGEANEGTLFDSGEKTGHDPAIRTDWLSLPADATPRQLQLATDMRADAASRGRDPLDIRDFTNWIDPQIRISPGIAGQSTAQASQLTLPGWTGWNVLGWRNDGEPTAAVSVRNQLETWNSREPRFRSIARIAGDALLLSRKFPLKPDDRWITIHAARPTDIAGTILCAVRINGQGVGIAPLPRREGPIDPQPVVFNIEAFAGQSALCEIVLFGDGSPAEFDFRGVAFSRHTPGIFPIFDEEEDFPDRLTDGEGTARISTDLPYSGRMSLEVRATGKSGPQLLVEEIPIREQPKLGEYRFLTFAWRKVDDEKKSKETIRLLVAHEGRIGGAIADAALDRLRGRPAVTRRGGREIPLEDRGMRHGYTYDAGDMKQSAGAPLRVDWSLPRNWQWVSRDLIGDFGSLSLTGLGFDTTGETAAFYDSIFLARTPQDVDRIKEILRTRKEPPKLPEGVKNITVRDEEYGPLLRQVAPQFVAMNSLSGLTLVGQHEGENDVVKSHPLEQNRPCRLLAHFAKAGSGPVTLKGRLRAEKEKDFKLVTLVNGRIIDDRLISGQDQWIDLEIDLTPHINTKIPLTVEVRQESNNWNYEFAWWKSLRVTGL
ncbi:MAG: hypothetical protein C0478_12715 [Planctomyces sp.]|nr:hypothetical protein [Planctomyces sp.]